MDRPAPRVNVKLPVTLTLNGSPLPTRGISVNLSETGVLVRAARRAERGTLVQLDFPEFKAKGEVIWTRDAGEEGTLLGMRFASIGWRDRRFVRSLVEAGTD